MRRRTSYALLGLVLSLGAPAGLLVLRGFEQGAFTGSWALHRIASDLSTFVYVGCSTALVFGLFGWALGVQADRLLDLSGTDALTGLKNMRVFRERLDDELGRAARDGQALALLFIDVDRLKHVNDTLGHRQGDQALTSVAEALLRTARSTDLVARWGGDEFVVLAPGTGAAAAQVLAQRVRAEVEATTAPAVTVSIGVAVAEGGGVDHTGLLELADASLYAAKQAGRNQVRAGPAAARG